MFSGFQGFLHFHCRYDGMGSFGVLLPLVFPRNGNIVSGFRDPHHDHRKENDF